MFEFLDGGQWRVAKGMVTCQRVKEFFSGLSFSTGVAAQMQGREI